MGYIHFGSNTQKCSSAWMEWRRLFAGDPESLASACSKDPRAHPEALQKIVGAALRRDSSKPSRDKPVPTAQPSQSELRRIQIQTYCE
jgi:hypothetical protein